MECNKLHRLVVGTMKYDREFEQFGKEDFIKALVREYGVKRQTAKRTWYKYVKAKQKRWYKPNNEAVKKKKQVEVQPKKPLVQRYLPEHKEELSSLKLLEFNDMLRLLPKEKITRKLLRQYGFRNPQINWLIDAGYDIPDGGI